MDSVVALVYLCLGLFICLFIFIFISISVLFFCSLPSTTQSWCAWSLSLPFIRWEIKTFVIIILSWLIHSAQHVLQFQRKKKICIKLFWSFRFCRYCSMLSQLSHFESIHIQFQSIVAQLWTLYIVQWHFFCSILSTHVVCVLFEFILRIFPYYSHSLLCIQLKIFQICWVWI